MGARRTTWAYDPPRCAAVAVAAGALAISLAATPAMADETRRDEASPIASAVVVGPQGGWMRGGYGRLEWTYTNHGDRPAKLLHWTGQWRAEPGGEVLHDWRAEPEESTTLGPNQSTTVGLTAWMPPQVADAVGNGSGMVSGDSVFAIGGETVQAPFTALVPVATLSEPTQKVIDGKVGVDLMQSRFSKFGSLPRVLDFLNQTYKVMHELTGYAPYDGRPMVYTEVPDNPAWAYAGEQIGLNTKFVPQTLSDWNRGIVAFGWVHEMGHNFDFGGWYIWSGPAAEAQANLKLYYAYERLLGPDSPFAAQATIHRTPGDPIPVNGRQFVDDFITHHASAYLANPDRGWQSLTSDEINALFMRMVRRHGWGMMKKWYRTHAALAERGLPRPESPQDKVRLSCAILSTITAEDMVPIFQQWRLPVTQADVQAVREAYPIADCVPTLLDERFGRWIDPPVWSDSPGNQ